MTEPIRNPNRCPSHPGAILRDMVVEHIDLTKVQVAEHLGISRQHLYDLLAERKPVTPQMAVRIGKLVGNSADIWLRLQSEYDLWHAKRDTDVSAIPTLEKA